MNASCVNATPILRIDGLNKVIRRGWFGRKKVFALHADFQIDAPSVVCIIGPNGAGKSSLFDLIAGHDSPTAGRIFCDGQNIHKVKHGERAHMVRYHRQSQYNRHKRRRFPPDFLMESASRDKPAIHLFDEPNGDEWITRLFFYTAQNLRNKGNVVLFAMHPGRLKDIAMMRGICDRFIYVENGRYMQFGSFEELIAYPPAHQYFSPLTEF
ncbi:MAG: ATP-binding cassette domain-containing protein [Burkholderiaceae bacterium]